MTFGGFTPFTLIDYPGKTAAMVYTIGCNFRCPYCHNPELVDETVEETYSEKFVLDFLKTRQGMLSGLVITGGEPTMHGDELVSFIKKVKKLSFLVKLDTNGTNPDVLQFLLDESLVDYVAMDIKGPLKTYNQIVGRPVDVEKIKSSIEMIKSSGVPYEFRTTIIKALLTPDDIKESAKLISGAEKYFLQKFIPTKILNPQFKRKVTYTDTEFAELQKIASEYVHYCGIR